MTRVLVPGAILLACGLGQTAFADGFAIDLQVSAGKVKHMAHTDPAQPGQKPAPRGALEVTAGQNVKVKWTMVNSGKTVAKDILVHFFAVKEDKVGQPQVPKSPKDIIAESALTMDFNPADRADGEMTLSIATPGFYLLRLETIGAKVSIDGREYFAAMDLIVR